MATTEVQIANMALLALGADTITSLDDTSSKEAVVASALYDQARDEVLMAHPWPCCVKRAWLDMDAPPAYGWDNAFSLPEDFLDLVEVEGVEPSTPQAYEVEDGHLLTNLSEVNIRYIYRNETPSSYTPFLTECIALNLASKMAYAIVGKESVANILYQKYERKLAEARCRDARTRQNEPAADDTLVTERY